MLKRERELFCPSKGLQGEDRIRAVVAGAEGLKRTAANVGRTSCIYYETDRSKIFKIEWPPDT